MSSVMNVIDGHIHTVRYRYIQRYQHWQASYWSDDTLLGTRTYADRSVMDRDIDAFTTPKPRPAFQAKW